MNWLKTASLMIVLSALVVMAGGLAGGMQGLYVALAFALLMNFFAYWFSDKMALMMARAKPVSEDEEPKKTSFDKVPKLRPVFKKDGTITAANASKLNDGGCAVVLASESLVKEKKLKPMAKILGWAQHSQEPMWFTTAPAGALQDLSRKTGLELKDFDLFEINEAFAVVALACGKILGLPMDRINVHGGAVALGHPIGASGARILVTLLNALKIRGAKRGAAGICLGGGEAMSLAVELA